MRSPKHIRLMNRSEIKTTLSTAVMAVTGVLVWLFWFADPCLGTTISNHWTAKNLADAAPPPPPDSDGLVAIENPYGIATCDHWPSASDQVLELSVFAIVAFAIGWIAARRIARRPLLAAAAITSTAMLIALSLQYWAHSAEASRLLRLELLASLVVILLAAAIAILGAWIAIRRARRP
jgi:hypothetical protein